jgi:hypothetical protein
MKESFLHCLAFGASACLLAGCAPTWIPPEPPQTAAMPQVLRVRDFGCAEPAAPRLYLRRDLKRPDAPPELYESATDHDKHIEGSLIGRSAGSLDRYIHDERDDPSAVHLAWPQSSPNGAGFFLALDPPLPRLPEFVDTREPTVSTCSVRLYNWRGKHLFRGMLERTVRYLGFAPAGTIANLPVECLRLEVRSRIRLHWGPTVNITEYLWLAPRLGEVRRIERLQGWAWFLPFDTAWQYDLVDPHRTDQLPRPGAAAHPLWSLIAIHLDRALPHPRVGGIMAEFDDGLLSVPPDRVADRTPPGDPVGG